MLGSLAVRATQRRGPGGACKLASRDHRPSLAPCRTSLRDIVDNSHTCLRRSLEKAAGAFARTRYEGASTNALRRTDEVRTMVTGAIRVRETLEVVKEWR